MADRSLLRHLTVLRDDAEKQPVPLRKFFAIGNPSDIEGYGETLPLLSWVEDNLSRFVLATGVSTAWGRASPAPVVIGLPNIAVKPKDGIFIVTGKGQDRSEPHPSGQGEMKIIFLNRTGSLYKTGVSQVHIYRLEGLQSKSLLAGPR